MSQLTFSQPRVAIIGAGPGGSSSAFTLSQNPITTVIYEKTDRVGGRVEAIDVFNQTIELGASIYVDVNVNLVNAVKLLNLTVAPDLTLPKTQSKEGIWDGREFKYVGTGGVWDIAKLVWRYGLAPYRARTHVTRTIKRFMHIYTAKSLPFFAKDFDFLEMTGGSGRDAFLSAGVSESFIGDIVNAATRVNYAQEVTQLHGLMSTVSFVTDGGYSVDGGNELIFKGLVERSHAELRLNASVTSISQIKGGWEVCVSSDCEEYHHVIIANPMSLSGITISPKIEVLPVEYVRLFVTIVATTANPSSEYFKTKIVPNDILTTTSDIVPEIQSLSVVGRAGRVLIYKIFSLNDLSTDRIHNLFEEDAAFLFMHRKTWNSYPIGKPTSEFDEWEKAEGLWYLNGMERFISTMETATIAGQIVARLVAERLRLNA